MARLGRWLVARGLLGTSLLHSGSALHDPYIPVLTGFGALILLTAWLPNSRVASVMVLKRPGAVDAVILAGEGDAGSEALSAREECGLQLPLVCQQPPSRLGLQGDAGQTKSARPPNRAAGKVASRRNEG